MFFIIQIFLIFPHNFLHVKFEMHLIFLVMCLQIYIYIYLNLNIFSHLQLYTYLLKRWFIIITFFKFNYYLKHVNCYWTKYFAVKEIDVICFASNVLETALKRTNLSIHTLLKYFILKIKAHLKSKTNLLMLLYFNAFCILLLR